MLCTLGPFDRFKFIPRIMIVTQIYYVFELFRFLGYPPLHVLFHTKVDYLYHSLINFLNRTLLISIVNIIYEKPE